MPTTPTTKSATSAVAPKYPAGHRLHDASSGQDLTVSRTPDGRGALAVRAAHGSAPALAILTAVELRALAQACADLANALDAVG